MNAHILHVVERAHARHLFGHLANAFDLRLQKRFTHRLGSCSFPRAKHMPTGTGEFMRTIVTSAIRNYPSPR